jgi:hypothetical protein
VTIPDPDHPLGPPPYPPPPYQHPYPYPVARPTNNLAIAAMVVSLASLFTCPLVGAVGIYLGNRARTEIRTSGEQGEGMAQAGVIVGWIAIALSVAWVCFFALFVFGPMAAIPFFAEMSR